MKRFLLFLLVVLLTACGSPGPHLSESSDPGRYRLDKDAAPDEVVVDVMAVADAEPRHEPRTAAGNKSPYMVFGKVYTVLPDAAGYRERGGASWYGKKFHGHQTSNGETYDMFAMTAAHKTLPIPSYVRVTNLANGRSVIVRVNDRGPFHDDRVIDLSYAAAARLGYINQGTAQVEVEAIDVEQWLAQKAAPAAAVDAPTAQLPAPAAGKNTWLQVGAYSEVTLAQSVYRQLQAMTIYPVQLESGVDHFHRVRIGPVAEDEVASIADSLQARGFPAPVRVRQQP